MKITVSQANGRIPVTIFHLHGDLVEEEPLHREAAQAVANGSQAILLDLQPMCPTSAAQAYELSNICLNYCSNRAVWIKIP